MHKNENRGQSLHCSGPVFAVIDKAATRRLLVAMAKHGFIEQSEDTRKYRLGHGFLRLASIREAAFPLAKAAQDAVDWLVHASIPGQAGMMTIAHKLPNRGRVINIVPSELLNYHATASGLAFLAFSTAETAEAIYALERAKLAPETTTIVLRRVLRALPCRFSRNPAIQQDVLPWPCSKMI